MEMTADQMAVASWPDAGRVGGEVGCRRRVRNYHGTGSGRTRARRPVRVDRRRFSPAWARPGFQLTLIITTAHRARRLLAPHKVRAVRVAGWPSQMANAFSASISSGARPAGSSGRTARWPLHRRPARRRVRDIGLHSGRAATQAADLGAVGLQADLAAGRHYQVRSRLGQRHGEARAEAAAGPSDQQRDLPGQGESLEDRNSRLALCLCPAAGRIQAPPSLAARSLSSARLLISFSGRCFPSSLVSRSSVQATSRPSGSLVPGSSVQAASRPSGSLNAVSLCS
jgi:hypothetical protein